MTKGLSPEEYLKEYTGDALEKDTIDFPSKTKDITIMLPEEHNNYILSILESKIPLRLHQEQIIQTTDFSKIDIKEPAYSIKSTKALVQSTQYKQGITPVISSLDEMQRFILNNCQKGYNGEDYNGQIFKPMLKSFKFHIPTSMKKFILNWFDNRGNGKKIVEDMYSNEQWWKRMFHHVHWCSKAKFSNRYRNVNEILTLLYSSDRSWTFNSLLEKAESNHDYGEVVKLLATERPGLLIRKMVMLCKYTLGVSLPVKKTESKNKGLVKTPLSDAAEWLIFYYSEFLTSKKPSVKSLWQLIEQLKNPIHHEPIYERLVQGKQVNYSTPIPKLNAELAEHVINSTLKYIKKVKIVDNATLGKVYLEPELGDVALQYSGANSNDISISGSFMTPGTSLPLPSGQIIRLGVVWKNIGNGSCDIDLATTLSSSSFDYVCHYGNPETVINKKIVATSSGDVTSCGAETYSAEFIDIDIDEAKASGITDVFNSLIMYSGLTLDKYDTHVFLSVINYEDRIMNRNTVNIDLAKQDYAIKLTDPVKGYIGMSLDLNAMTMTSLAIPNNTPGWSSAIENLESFKKIINNIPRRLPILYGLEHSIHESQLEDDASGAETIIGTSNDSPINPTTQLEELQQIVF
jgi:hypothetical protein